MVAKRSFTIIILTFLFATNVLANGTGLDLSFHKLEFSEIYRVLGESQGLNVLVDPSVTGKGTLQLKDVSFQEALELISQHSGYAYHLTGNTLLVAKPERFAEYETQDVRYITTKFISSNEILDALALIMPKTDVYVQPEGGLVVLKGPEKVLDKAEELILALDNSVTSKGEIWPGRSLLEIFKDLSEEMGLNLLADPTLEEKKLYLDIRKENPEEVIRQIQQLVNLKVEITEHSLVVGKQSDVTQERLKVYRLDYADPEVTQNALTMFISSERIRVDKERQSVIVRGTDAQLAEIDLFLIDFDQPAPQVLLEVWVQEMSSDAMQHLGIDWKGTPSFSGGDAPVFLELEWEPWELVLALRALEDKGEAKLLANPKIATLSGQDASIFVGDRVPVVLTSEEGISQVDFLEAGIDLKVTPRISDDEYITIGVKPEVSTFIWKVETDYPQIRTREAETTVRVKDGQPIVIGGLLQEQETELITKIPFLSQLPVLGKLFQWRETKKNQTEMTIFLIPRIVEGEQGLVNQGFFTQTQ